jgi:hypothetical protein
MVFNWVPIFGLTKARIKKEIPMIKNTNFKVDLNTETSGANFFSKGDLENLSCLLFFHHNTNRKTRMIIGMIPNK